MNRRRNSLEVEPVVYEGEVVESPSSNSKNLMSAEKIQLVSNLVEASIKIIDIFKTRTEGQLKINEMEVAVKQFQAETERQVSLLKAENESILKKGEAISLVLGQLTPILLKSDLPQERLEVALKFYEKAIEKAIEDVSKD